MRHKYGTRAVVLGRRDLAEASASVDLLTEEFGVLRARAQGVRKPGAKMSAALQTLALSEVTLIRGKDGWRMAGALLGDAYAQTLTPQLRVRAARVLSLLERLVRGEHKQPEIFTLMQTYLQALTLLSDEPLEIQDAAEVLAALRLLNLLGFDAGTIPGELYDFDTTTLQEVVKERTALIARINTGIGASGM